MPKFFISEHQHKGRPYAEALAANGWERINFGADPDLDLAMFDHDTDGENGFRKPLDYLHNQGIPVVIYPHAARPNVTWDGMYKIWPHTALQIIVAEGHREVLEAYEYPLPTAVCGWCMCEQRPWHPAEVKDRPINVLFAPIHANRNGWLHPINKALNAFAFQRLIETPGIRLTVRHIMRLDYSGLWEAPGVKYVLANTNGRTDEIDEADLVVAHQTYAYLAIARGKPLIMLGDDITPHSGNAWSNVRWAKTYDAYRDLLRYPLDIEQTHNWKQLRAMIEQAIRENVGAAWRKKFIGKQMDGAKFARRMKQVIENKA